MDSIQILAAPSLMNIPAECRTYIFKSILHDEPSTIEVGPDEQPDELWRPSIRSWNVGHPLLLVSKQVYRESSQYFTVILAIRDVINDRWETLSGLCDGLTPFIMQSIDTIIVGRPGTYVGGILNRERFPKLKRLVVEMRLTRDIFQSDVWRTSRAFSNADAEKFVQEVLAGKHDAAIVEFGGIVQKRSRINSGSSFGTYETRGFELHCRLNLLRVVPLVASQLSSPIEISGFKLHAETVGQARSPVAVMVNLFMC